MTRVIDVNTLDEKSRFTLKLQLALRINAINIKKESKSPEKFDDYILERERLIRNMVNEEGDLRIVEGEKTLFP